MRAVVIDHGLQEGSADVAQRAAGAAEELGVPAEVVAVTVDAAPGVSVEAAARTARYAALAAAAEAAGRDIWSRTPSTTKLKRFCSARCAAIRRAWQTYPASTRRMGRA